MQVSAEQLEAFLLDSGLVTKQQLAQAKEQAQAKKQNLADVVVGQGLVNKEQMAKLKAYILGIPFVDLTQQKAEKQVLILIPEIIARKHSIVAYRREGDNLEVAMLDPEDLQMIDFIKKKTNLKILPR